jgi:hypothetical protein
MSVRTIFLDDNLPPMFHGENAVSPSPDIVVSLDEDGLVELLGGDTDDPEPLAFVQGVAGTFYLFRGTNDNAVVRVVADSPVQGKRPVAIWRRGNYPENFKDALTWMTNQVAKDLSYELLAQFDAATRKD